MLNNTKWLLPKISDLEEDNLKYITQFQTADNTIEVLKKQFDKKSAKLNAELDYVQKQCDSVRNQIEIFESKTESYEYMCNLIESTDPKNKMANNAELEKLTKQIEMVH